MTARVAINGFGRIGRLVLRAAFEAGRSDLDFVVINDLADVTSIVFGAATAEKVKQNIELSETNAMQNELRQLMRSNFDMVPNISPHRAFGL